MLNFDWGVKKIILNVLTQVYNKKTTMNMYRYDFLVILTLIRSAKHPNYPSAPPIHS